ncbi:MAG: non-hydrolyzing UDP-N-acetylglucosamine 2-epimerase [Deferribacterales bacterium]
MKKVLFVFGTRPEAIKMAPVIKKFYENNGIVETKICVTAQHREMLDNVLGVFDIKPDYDLDIMKENQDLFDITAAIITGMKQVLSECRPDLVFVHGDTSTTFCASLAAYYSQIPVAHIEAGLRTGDIYSPFPEEVNRLLTGRIASWHFAPTESAQKNLLREGVSSDRIFVTGNTVIDALLRISAEPETDSCPIEGYEITDRKIILVTGHRRESFGEGFENICLAIRELSGKYPDTDIVYPVHLNPNVQRPVNSMLSGVKNIHLIKPLDYRPFIRLMKASHIILTDSGGIQEEAPSLNKPVVVMRDVTERHEAVAAGTAVLAGSGRERIVRSVSELMENHDRYKSVASSANPYGSGNASDMIFDVVKRIVSNI